MNEDFERLDKTEQVEAENEFLKMKLMLEKGAQFGVVGKEELDPEIENMFLKNVMEYEKQFESRKMIRVFDKIGKPDHYRPVSEIPDTEIENEWRKLSKHLFHHGISLDVCSPNVSVRELYRFTIEEFFQHEIDDINIPGMMHGFIYDEFYPDIPYENTRAATEDCIERILHRELLEWIRYVDRKDLRLNDHYPLTMGEFIGIVNRFKSSYEELELKEISGVECAIRGDDCRVTGHYLLRASTGIDSQELSGKWEVVSSAREGCWDITEIHIENINF